MECPHCKKELMVADRCYRNADVYRNAVCVTTECCGKLVIIKPLRSYNITADMSERKMDDWGVPVKAAIFNPMDGG